MEVYKGPHLVIQHEKENSRLINVWNSSPDNDIAYTKELIEHLHIIEKIKPSQVMWILDEMTFKASDVTKKWVDEYILKPVFNAGFIARDQDGYDQIAFVVGKDVLVYIRVINLFKKFTPNSFRPKYFSSEIEARNWLNQGVETIKDNEGDQKLEILFKGSDDNGKVVFEIKEMASKFNNTINSFKTIIQQNYFMKNNFEKYSSLTPREKETLKFIVKGYANKQISEEMHVSHHTIRTHRNRIWQKLEIKHFRDCLKFECFFS